MGKNDNAEEQGLFRLESEKAEGLLKNLEGWNFSPDKNKISRNFSFKNFQEAVDFINGVAVFAEKIRHYPDVIIVRCHKITVELTTRRVGGLSEKDFILASEIDAIAGWKNKLEQWLVSPKVLVVLFVMLLSIILWQYFG